MSYFISDMEKRIPLREYNTPQGGKVREESLSFNRSTKLKIFSVLALSNKKFP
jgi:hypothetical protein